MAKYVCDFETVKSTASKLDSYATTMDGELSSYISNINASISNWSGIAKEKYVTSTNNHIAKIRHNINQVRALSEFIKKAADTIESTDQSLASLSI